MEKVGAQMSSDFLDRILKRKRIEIEAAQRRVPEARVREMAGRLNGGRRSLVDALRAPGPQGLNIISEIKRASPSKGLIHPELDVQGTARSYERGGAVALSVLTDRDFFQARPTDLQEARTAVNLPVLRKDFIISPYQVYETAVMGADALLLIVKALTRDQLKGLLELCGETGLDALVEVHSKKELEDATWAGATLIGFNNRDLTTFETDLRTSVSLAPYLAPHQVGVSESGIRTRGDIVELLRAGIWNFLIGESLVRAENPEVFLQMLLGH